MVILQKRVVEIVITLLLTLTLLILKYHFKCLLNYKWFENARKINMYSNIIIINLNNIHS